WEVATAPAPDDVAQLQTWVRVRTGKTFDEEGVLRQLHLADWLQDWKACLEKGSPWEPSPNAERWHPACAREAEGDRDWFAALFHLTRLLQQRPEDGDLLGRRGQAYAQLKRWSEALADYTHILKGQPANLAALTGRATVQAELGHWKEAIHDWQSAVQFQ